ncbi:MAG: RibD family protein [Myxococcota bacterium]
MSILERVRDRLAFAGRYHQATGLPYSTIAYAQSLDGSIAASSGSSLAISGTQSLEMTHHLRAHHDAILVGIETVRVDNPRLTVRLVSGEHPQPVVLDTELRLSPDARIVSHPKRPWLMTGDSVCSDRRAALEKLGVRVFTLGKDATGKVDLWQVLRTLGELGIRSLMIEGGARVIDRFLELRLANQLIVTTSPMFVGGVRPVARRPLGGHYPSLRDPVYERWGADMVMASDLEGPPAA